MILFYSKDLLCFYTSLRLVLFEFNPGSSAKTDNTAFQADR